MLFFLLIGGLYCSGSGSSFCVPGCVLPDAGSRYRQFLIHVNYLLIGRLYCSGSHPSFFVPGFVLPYAGSGNQPCPDRSKHMLSFY